MQLKAETEREFEMVVFNLSIVDSVWMLCPPGLKWIRHQLE